MKLKSLYIQLQPSYADNAGKYTGEFKWEGEHGNISLVISPELSEKLLAFIGPVLTKFSHVASLELERSLQASVDEARKVPAIEVGQTIAEVAK